MYPALILRAELVCLVLLLFLFFTAKTYKMGKDSVSFSRLLCFAIIHVIFDAVTVLTVNSPETVPHALNYACHIVFYMSAILYANELFYYVVRLCFPNISEKIYYAGLGLSAIYLLMIPLLPMEFVYSGGTYSSTGPAAYVGFAVGFIYFASSVIITLINAKKLPVSVTGSLLPMMLVLIATETVQILYRPLLFTGGAVTIVTIGFFFSLENPAAVFERKAMTDALTGVSSRHSYNSEMARLDSAFKKSPNQDYTFLFCDIDGLRSVNSMFGHYEGDRYITLVAMQLMKCMKKANGIYRMGGDEFLVIYCSVEENVIKTEIENLKNSCLEAGKDLEYNPSVSVGYAVSSDEYSSLKDVIRTADYMMYKNKVDSKRFSAVIDARDSSTKLNVIGLTDRVFDAMCQSNERLYPFIMNLDTYVSRLSPYWVEQFDIPGEFVHDFNSVWIPLIHPDDRQFFTDDITAVLNGSKKVHSCKYRVLNRDGEYVRCSGRGTIYHGLDGEPDIFAGYLINYGIEETVDSVTGLRNFSVLHGLVQKHLIGHIPAVIVKLRVNNFTRINMLYGYEGGNSVLKGIGEAVVEELNGKGEVFCQDSTNFSILLPGATRREASELFRRISEKLANGIYVLDSVIPLEISGGALDIPADYGSDRKTIRSSLIYALDESTYSERNQLVFYNDLSDDGASSDLNLLAAIHRDSVSGRKYFVMKYMPIVDTQTGRVSGAEALMRWQSPEQGEISPSAFISFLETDPCFYDLSMHLLRQAVSDAAYIREHYFPDFRLNFNVTSLQLQNGHFVEHVLNILKESCFPADALVLELTERCKELDTEFLRGYCEKLHSHGIRTAFDDMGTGYSTVNLLMNIPVDEIKLDKQFTDALTTNPYYPIFVSALFQGAEQGRYTICFEGVESEDRYRYITQFGDSLCQGYYFAPPLSFERLKQYSERNMRNISSGGI